ncbi:MAG TPA: cupin domain-containing protein [Pseudolabrys sp.]|nr:cupin domain-containing protein [Pseudolabrys sp.]
MPLLTTTDIIRLLDLKPHPEGWHFRETFRDSKLIDGRQRPDPHVHASADGR